MFRHLPKLFKMNELKEYPIIRAPASGRSVWYGGARSWIFVYSRDHGNFILEGYQKECMEYLEKNYTHYFYYLSMWSNKQSRGFWRFWKDGIGIFTPERGPNKWKYTVRKYTGGKRNISLEESNRTALHFKRLPKHWIPEFNKF